MGLDYSQRQLLGSIITQKGRRVRGRLSSMKRKQNFISNLQVYAFWTGFASTIISLIQVVIIATKN